MTKEYSDYLAHHGVKGQKWGVRRYQNEDGTLTAEGQNRYDTFTPRQKKQYDSLPPHFKNVMDKKMDKGKSFTRSINETRSRQRTAAITALAVGVPLIYGGAYALSYFGTKGLFKVGMKAAQAVSHKMKTSQGWHNLMNRVKARRTGDIVLGRKDYTISAGWLNGVRR